MALADPPMPEGVIKGASTRTPLTPASPNFLQTLQALHPYEVLNCPNVDDGLVRGEGQEVPACLQSLRKLVKALARKKRESS